MSGKMAFEGTMECGLKQGVCREYHFNGKLKCEELFVDDEMQGDQCTIYSSQEEKIRGSVYLQHVKLTANQKNEMLNEIDESACISDKEFGPIGIVFKGQFKNGKRNGFGIQFDELSNCLEYAGFYNDDLKEGNYVRSYHPYNYSNLNETLPEVENIYELCEQILISQNFNQEQKDFYFDILNKNLKDLNIKYVKTGILRYQGGMKCS